MALVTKNNTFSAGAVIVASEHNDNFDTIYNDYNGNITNANIAAGAAIVDTKLAQISTASKVNMTALVETGEAAGDLLFRDATNWSRLAVGSDASVLAADSGTGFPYWASLAAISLSNKNMIKGWVSFEADGAGATRTIRNQFNVSQVLDYGAGTFGVYWNTDFASSSYAVVATGFSSTGLRSCQYYSMNAGSVSILCRDDNATPNDPVEMSVIALGDQ